MQTFLRVIDRKLWPTEGAIKTGMIKIADLRGNTITRDLRTTNDTLSIWRVENPRDAVLGFITNGNKINTVHILKITEESLRTKDLKIEQTDPRSRVKDLNDKHYDVTDINYKKLGDFAEVILEALKTEENLEEFVDEEVYEILREAINQGRVKKEKLDPKLQEEIRKKYGEKAI